MQNLRKNNLIFYNCIFRRALPSISKFVKLLFFWNLLFYYQIGKHASNFARKESMQIDAIYSGYRVLLIIAFSSKKDEICVFVGAHAKPQLHRFSLGRFAARIREISSAKYISTLPSPSYSSSVTEASVRSSTYTIVFAMHDYTARYISGMCIPLDSTPWFFFPSPSRSLSSYLWLLRAHTNTHTYTYTRVESVLYSARARISARGKRATKRKRVAATPANSVPRTSFA